MRVATEALDRFLNAAGEVILSSKQLRTASRSKDRDPAQIAVAFDQMDRMVGEIQRRALELRTTPLLRVLDNLPRTARDLAERLGKRVQVELVGAQLELDRSILDRLGDPLTHLIRNAVDHGIEAPEDRVAAGKNELGRITIEARRERDTICISVGDDGRGIDLDAVRARAVEAGLILADLAEDMPPDQLAALVFRPGLSTATRVTEISGRGVGMDAVKATIEALGGSVELSAKPGLGTTISLVVPITAAVQRVLLVSLGVETAAIPVAKVERILEIESSSIERGGREAFALIDDEPVLVLDLAECMCLPCPPDEKFVPIALVEVRGERVALRVQRFVGQLEIYVKPVPELLGGVRALSGLTVLGDGRPIFLLDLNQLV